MGFPCDSAGKEFPCSVGDLNLISRLGRSPGEGNSYPLQYSWCGKESDMTEGLSLSFTFKCAGCLDEYFEITVSISCSVVSDSLGHHGLWSARLLCQWNSPG